MDNSQYYALKLEDANHILESRSHGYVGYPLIESLAQKFDPSQPNLPTSLLHSNLEQIRIRMLKTYEDGNEHHYMEMHNALFPNKKRGYDADSWKSLVTQRLIEFYRTGPRNLKFYKITNLGREVLRAADANQIYFRVARWFKKNENPYAKAIAYDMSNNTCSYEDLDPKTIIELLENLFNPDSHIRQMGTAYRWMNNLVYLIKTNQYFFEILDNPDITAWLAKNADNYLGIKEFMHIIQKSKQKHAQ